MMFTCYFICVCLCFNTPCLSIHSSIHINSSLTILYIFQGYLTGGKDGIVVLWDEVFQNVIKSYNLEQNDVAPGSQLFMDYPPIRALSLGQDCILVGTKNAEVRVWLGVWSQHYYQML